MKTLDQYHPSFGEEEAQAAATYIRGGGWLTENKETEAFERSLAAYVGVNHASCVNNGTISLSLALLAAKVNPGDRVIVPDITMIATANAAKFIGVEPVFIDVDENLCLDLKKAYAAAVNDKRIAAVLYVSLNGRSHPASVLWAHKERFKTLGVSFIEDAAQSFGSKTPDGLYLGTIGDVGSFSFSPHKIISTGQGGALVTNSDEIHDRIERLKDFGRLSGGGDIHDHFGINSKFTDLQSVIGMEQLKKVDWRIARKKEIYGWYEERLRSVAHVRMIETDPNCVPWFVDIYTEMRDGLALSLKGRGIGTRPIYPALHTQKIFQSWNSCPWLTRSEDYGRSGLWLPSSFDLTEEDVDRVCLAIQDFFML